MEEYHTPSRQRKRLNACQRCRKRKVKCSGEHPCEGCSRRSLPCEFDPEERKIAVSARYLHELKRKAEGAVDEVQGSPDRRRRASTQGSNHRSREIVTPTRSGVCLGYGEGATGTQRGATALPTPASPETVHAPAEDDIVMSNPLASEQSSYLIDSSGSHHFLGPSSTWTFSRRVFDLIQRTNRSNSPGTALNLDGTAYNLANVYPRAPILPDKSSLPSLDYSLYLTNTVKFHLGQMSHLFDEDTFMKNLFQFYSNTNEQDTSALWYVQFLLVIAFGKAFLVQTKATPGMSIPGSDFFIRAIKSMPDFLSLYEDPLLAIEILCLVSLYFHCADLRNIAYSYIGQALRMAISKGLHKEMPSEQFAPKLSERRRNIWWTVYNLDMKFSSLLGAPISIQKEHITVRLPSIEESTHRSAALKFDVKLSRLIAQVINTVYGVDGSLHATFLTSTQSLLRGMADVGKEMEEVFELKSNCAVNGISRVVANVHLSYHQCIVLAIRPLLLRLLEIGLQESGQTTRVYKNLSDSVKALVQTCLNSARKMLGLVLAMKDHNLLESFLPFDLEHTFSSALVVILVSAILPSSNQGHAYNGLTYRDTVTCVLDDMILKGSVPAQFRKIELEELERNVASCLRRDNSPPTSAAPAVQSAEPRGHRGDWIAPAAPAAPQVPQTAPPSLPSSSSTLVPGVPTSYAETIDYWGPNWDSLDEHDFLSPVQMLAVAELLELELDQAANFNGGGAGGAGDGRLGAGGYSKHGWLWGEGI